MRAERGAAVGRWALTVFSLSFRKLIAYRADFWAQTAGIVFGTVFVSYFFWAAVFESQGVNEVAGFTLRGMIFYYALTLVVQRVVGSSEWGTGAEDIYQGTLTRYLVYPVPYFLYKYVERLAAITVAGIQYALLFLVFAACVRFPAEFHVTVGSALASLGVCLVGGFFYFCAQTFLEGVAFWQDTIWSLIAMLRIASSFLSGALVPLSFFPGWAAALLHYTPFPHLVSLPIRALIGQAGAAEIWSGIGVLACWCLVSMAAMVALWAKGLRGYSGGGQ